MKKFLLVVCLFLTLTLPVLAFDGPTHSYVTRKGVEFLLAIKPECSKLYTRENVDLLLKYCVQPDIDETDGAFSQHFFNLITQKNFKGGEDSAKTKAGVHWYNAVAYFRKAVEGTYSSNSFKTIHAKTRFKTDMERAMEKLGRCLHYFEDLSTPVHTNTLSVMDASLKFAKHVAFEERCKKLHKRDIVVSNLFLDLDYFTYNNIANLCYGMADKASQNFEALLKKYSSIDEVAICSIINAQQQVAGILYKFYVLVTTNYMR